MYLESRRARVKFLLAANVLEWVEILSRIGKLGNWQLYQPQDPQTYRPTLYSSLMVRLLTPILA